MSKPDHVRNAIDRTAGKFTKALMLETCPDTGEAAIERTLEQFLDARFIRKIGAGRDCAHQELRRTPEVPEHLSVFCFPFLQSTASLPSLAQNETIQTVP